MKSTELWSTIITENPHYLNEGVHLTHNGLKKLFDLAYQHGFEEGCLQSKKENDTDSLFDSIFGKRH